MRDSIDCLDWIRLCAHAMSSITKEREPARMEAAYNRGVREAGLLVLTSAR